MEEDKYISSTVKLSTVICMSKIILWFFLVESGWIIFRIIICSWNRESV